MNYFLSAFFTMKFSILDNLFLCVWGLVQTLQILLDCKVTFGVHWRTLGSVIFFCSVLYAYVLSFKGSSVLKTLLQLLSPSSWKGALYSKHRKFFSVFYNFLIVSLKTEFISVFLCRKGYCKTWSPRNWATSYNGWPSARHPCRRGRGHGDHL